MSQEEQDLQQRLQEEEEEEEELLAEEEEEEAAEAEQLRLSGGAGGLFRAFQQRGRGGGGGAWANLIVGLSSEDPSEMLLSASEFSAQLLHAATQEQLQGLDVSAAVPALLRLLQYEHNGELMLMGVRALYNLIDAIPNAVRVVVRSQGVDALVQQLLAINYVDVAEEAIRVLHCVSQGQPAPCLRAGCMMAMLSYIDFFALPVQRRCAKAVASMARAADPEMAPQVLCCSGNLAQLLNHTDPEVRSSIAGALHNLTDMWHGRKDLCDSLAGDGLVGTLLQLVGEEGALGVHSLTCLRNLCATSVDLSGQAVSQGLISALEGLLQSQMQPNAALEVANAMFPTTLPGLDEDADEDAPQLPPVEIMCSIGSLLLPLVLQLYERVLDSSVRYRCVLLVAQLCSWTPADHLLSFFPVNDAAHLASTVLRSRQAQDQPQQLLALVIVGRLLAVVPEGAEVVARAGIVGALHALSQSAPDEQTVSMCVALLEEHFPRQEGESEAEWLATPTVKRLRALAPLLRNPTAREGALIQLAETLRSEPPSGHEWHSASLEQPLLDLLMNPGPDLAARRAAFCAAFDEGANAALRAILQSVLAAGAGALPVGVMGNFNSATSMINLRLEGPLGVGLGRVEPCARISRIMDSIAATPPSLSQHLRSKVEAARERVTRRLRASAEGEFGDFMESEMRRVEGLEGEEQILALQRLKNAIQERVMEEMQEHGEDMEELEEEEEEEEEEELAAAAAAAAEQAKEGEKKTYSLMVQGRVLDPERNLVQELVASGAAGGNLWNEPITVQYLELESPPVTKEVLPFCAPREHVDPLDARLAHLPVSIGVLSNTLTLLNVLAVLSEGEPDCEVSAISAKARKCLASPMASASGAYPPWLHQCVQTPAVPSEVRQLFFKRTAFGILRALIDTVGEGGGRGRRGGFSYDGNPGAMRFGRLPRDKVRVSRDNLLQAAHQVLRMYGGSRGMLEVEYYGEVGVGLGPTLEWFTLCSRELQQASLGLWLNVVDSSQGGRYVYAPQGLFPAPLAPGAPNEEDTLRLFRTAGALMAKSLMDSHLLDLSLSPVFWDWLVQRRPLSLEDLRSVYPALGAAIIEKREALSLSGLGMTLTGYDAWELVPNGQDVDLDGSNMELYVSAHLDAFLGQGVERQRQAILEGWATVFDPAFLRVPTAQEIDSMLCGDPNTAQAAAWQLESLKRTTKCDHGYHQESRQVVWLLECLSEFDAEQKRQFLRFCTGSPRLPVGGFASLHPRLTVVEKVTPGRHADEMLLSVMTCANFLKLPAYSSKEILRKRLLTAQEMCGGFHFS